MALSAYSHQDLPFEKLVEELKPERSLSYSPLFQVMFALQNTTQVPLRLPGLKVERLDLGRETSKFDLSLYAIETSEGLKLSFEYNSDLFDAATIVRMIGPLRNAAQKYRQEPREEDIAAGTSDRRRTPCLDPRQEPNSDRLSEGGDDSPAF